MRDRPALRARVVRNRPSAIRNGISLVEVLISMFVLLFGLMGVAAIFPVGNHFVVEGEKFDLGSALAQNAFEELKARGLLRPEVWHYADPNNDASDVVSQGTVTQNNPNTGEFDALVMQSPTLVALGGPNPDVGRFNMVLGGFGPGHAFVLDPLGNSEEPSLTNLDLFPRATDANGNLIFGNPWFQNGPNGALGFQMQLSGERWPVRRITVLDATGQLRTAVGETIFRLRDDLSIEQPDETDIPSNQLWRTADVNIRGRENNSIDDFRDDQLLLRQYKGDYSWLATIVPTTDQGLLALQPADDNYGEIACDVSVVVFRKRDFVPLDNERMLFAELLVGGELLLYSQQNDDNDARDEVDDALDDIRAGNWISLMGVNQTTGDFVLNWYRILSMGSKDDTEMVTIPSQGPSGRAYMARRLMLAGPDWPAIPNPRGGFLPYIPNLRAGLLPGVISVVTKPLQMEHTSLWSLE